MKKSRKLSKSRGEKQTKSITIKKTNRTTLRQPYLTPLLFKTRKYTLTINWEDVHFSNDKLSFKISEKYYSNKLYYKGLKESFNHLKKLFAIKNLLPLVVDFDYENVTKVQNAEQMETVIGILEIENFIHFDLYPGKSLRLSNLKLHKNDVCSIYQLYGKSQYFDNLIRIQGEEFKVVPVPEVILGAKKKIVKVEDSFLFSWERKDIVFIIWESVAENKATYIFTTAKSNYENQLQKIFDYVSSPLIKNKRELLRAINHDFVKRA